MSLAEQFRQSAAPSASLADQFRRSQGAGVSMAEQFRASAPEEQFRRIMMGEEARPTFSEKDSINLEAQSVKGGYTPTPAPTPQSFDERAANLTAQGIARAGQFAGHNLEAFLASGAAQNPLGITLTRTAAEANPDIQAVKELSSAQGQTAQSLDQGSVADKLAQGAGMIFGGGGGYAAGMTGANVVRGAGMIPSAARLGLGYGTGAALTSPDEERLSNALITGGTGVLAGPIAPLAYTAQMMAPTPVRGAIVSQIINRTGTAGVMGGTAAATGSTAPEVIMQAGMGALLPETGGMSKVQAAKQKIASRQMSEAQPGALPVESASPVTPAPVIGEPIQVGEGVPVTERPQSAQGVAAPVGEVSLTDPAGSQTTAVAGQPVVEPVVIEAPASPEALSVVPEAAAQGDPVPPVTASKSGITSIKNARVDTERAARNLPPAMQAAEKEFGATWGEAMAKVEDNPMVGSDLVAELKAKPRPLTDTENAVLLHRQIELQNEHAKASQAVIDAAAKDDPVALAEQETRLSNVSDSLLDVYNVGKLAGTENARGLAARRMMAAEDFSLAKMETDKRAVNGGRSLTPEERVAIRTAHEKIAMLETQLVEQATRMEAMQAEAALNLAHAKLVAGAKTPRRASPQANPSSKGYGRKNKIVSADEAQVAREQLREAFRRTNTGVDPTLLVPLTKLGVFHLEAGAREFAAWSKTMIDELGEKVAPHLEEVWGQVRSQFHAVQREATIKDAQELVLAGGAPNMGAIAQKLARGFVEQGINERGTLVKAVHPELQKIHPKITERETMDAISGYGQFKQLSKDEVSKQLRDLKGQLQQVGKLEDMQAKKAPAKTGVERRTPSDEERALIKQVNEAKRKGGFQVVNPELQLKTSLDAIKTRLRNQISDLTNQIDSGKKTVPTKSQIVYDLEAKALRDRRDALKEQFDSIFGEKAPRVLSDEQRVKLAKAAIEKSIAELDRRIKTGDLFPRPKESKTPKTQELTALRARRDAMREELKALRDAAEPKKTPEEIALQAYKTRTTNKIAEYEERLANGDFAPTVRKTVQRDQQAERLAFELEKAKTAWLEGLHRDNLAKRTTFKKIFDAGRETINTARAVLTSLDLSAVLRQGGAITLAHPIRAVRAFPAMIDAFRSEARAHAINAEIQKRPNAPLYKQSGLYLAEEGTASLSKMEEAYMSRWANKIPLVAGSQRAYTTFLNKLRADSFDAMREGLARNGPLTQAESKAIANFINVATGRGNLGAMEKAAVGLNTIFFAPRYVASRFQLIAGQPLYGGSARTRALVAQEYAKTLTGLGVVYGLGTMAGGEIETDPRSSDFGKIRFGETRLDPLFGTAQSTVLLSRLAPALIGRSVQTKTLDGTVKDADGASVIGRFLRTKLSPVFGTGVNLFAGKDVVGNDVTLGSAAANMVIPLAMRDIAKAMEDQGVAKGTVLGLISLFGMSLQTYGQQGSANATSSEIEAMKQRIASKQAQPQGTP